MRAAMWDFHRIAAPVAGKDNTENENRNTKIKTITPSNGNERLLGIAV
jgi:hypothetical protein